jgi:hypothetical protein
MEALRWVGMMPTAALLTPVRPRKARRGRRLRVRDRGWTKRVAEPLVAQVPLLDPTRDHVP